MRIMNGVINKVANIYSNHFLFLAVDNKYFNKIIQLVSFDVVSNYKKHNIEIIFLSSKIISIDIYI